MKQISKIVQSPDMVEAFSANVQFTPHTATYLRSPRRSWSLASTWLTPGYCRHLESEPAAGSSLFLCVHFIALRKRKGRRRLKRKEGESKKEDENSCPVSLSVAFALAVVLAPLSPHVKTKREGDCLYSLPRIKKVHIPILNLRTHEEFLLFKLPS